jgi:hypothetical protein
MTDTTMFIFGFLILLFLLLILLTQGGNKDGR